MPNLPALREIGFATNHRFLAVQRAGRDCFLGEDALAQVIDPVTVEGQRAAALRFTDPRAQAALGALLVFRLLPRGFSNRELRDHLAPLLGLHPSAMTQGRMSYELRRLRLHGLIERMPKTHRYRVTDFGLRAALFLTHAHNRLLRPGMADASDPYQGLALPLRRDLERLHATIDRLVQHAGLGPPGPARSRLAA